MGALFIGAAVLAAAYFISMGKTANVAKDLMYNFKNAKIHKFADGGEMIVRLFVDFTNLHDSKLFIQNAYLTAALDGITVGTVNVNNVELQKGVNNKYFDLVMPWRNLGIAAILQVRKWFADGQVKTPANIKISGQLKVEGVIIKINQVIPFSGQQ